MHSRVPDNKIGRRPTIGIYATVSMTIIIAFMLAMAGISAASGEEIRTEPTLPVSGEDFTITLNATENSIVMLSIENETGYVFWSDIVSLVNGSVTIGPLSLAEGNYTLNATFWSGNNAGLTPTFYNKDFSVHPPVEAPEKYDAIFVIVVGISVVFSVLALLALFTYITGRFFPEEKAKPVEISDDSEKIAAIAAAIKFRRG